MIVMKFKKILVKIFHKISPYLVANIYIFRVIYTLRLLNNFEKETFRFSRQVGASSVNISALWDSDGRFKWLSKVDSKDFGLSHFPRAIYRIGFEYYINRAGYGDDLSIGKAILKFFIEKNIDSLEKNI